MLLLSTPRKGLRKHLSISLPLLGHLSPGRSMEGPRVILVGSLSKRIIGPRVGELYARSWTCPRACQNPPRTPPGSPRILRTPQGILKTDRNTDRNLDWLQSTFLSTSSHTWDHVQSPSDSSGSPKCTPRTPQGPSKT